MFRKCCYVGLILASKSPRRRELLSLLGIDFKVVSEDIDETIRPDVPVTEEIKRLSYEKALAVVNSIDTDDIIIAADTVVVINNRIFGKPENEADAVSMLKALSGKTHSVITGITVMSNDKSDTRAVVTEVNFRNLSDTEISAYVKTGDPLDKAGAYAIQGISTIFITGISGDHFNVYGLPLCTLADMLRSFGVTILGEYTEGKNA
ncbi:MAG: septum formation inhibitor Maf [Clostridia bacterium]|nr:septum formation inhibitor Maf [Clostridia bacterium]